MKQNGTEVFANESATNITETHTNGFPLSVDTLLRAKQFTLDDETKVKLISDHFKQIMILLGLDLNEDSLKGTPDRVAKMYVKEIFSGLDPNTKPKITLFENNYQYREMLVEKDITVYSYCEHHFVPIIGKAHVAYISSGKVIGLSKINRIVHYYCKRPQVQERLTEQIAQAVKEALQTEDVAVVINATHLCIAARGVNDTGSSTNTSHYSGKFKNEETQQKFLSFLK